MEHMNTVLEYMYRDASNYKQHHSVVLRGRLSETEMKPYLIDGMFLIPSSVGLPDLQERFRDQGFKYPNEDDHVWHEVVNLKPTNDTPTTSLCVECFMTCLRNSYSQYLHLLGV